MANRLTYNQEDSCLNPLQNFISQVFDESDQIVAASTWRFKGKMNELFYYKNSVTRKGLLVNEYGEPYEFINEPSKIPIQEAYERNFNRYSKISNHRKGLIWFKKYELRESVAGEVKKLLGESTTANAPLPKQFDHLKWEMEDYQIHELDRFVKSPLEAISERDMKNISKIIGIPEKSLLSIHNTYSPETPEISSTEIDFAYPSLEKGATMADLGLNIHNSNKQLSLNKSLNKMSEYKTTAQNRTETRMHKLQTEPNQGVQLMENPRMDEFLMMYLEVDFKPNEIDISPTKKIIMSMNREESGDEFYQSLGESLEQFNSIYGTGYILTGSYIKEGDNKCIIGVDWKMRHHVNEWGLSELVNKYGVQKGHDIFEIKQKNKKRKQSVVDGLEKSHYDRAYRREHWDSDKSKIMRDFHSGELGYADPWF